MGTWDSDRMTVLSRSICEPQHLAEFTLKTKIKSRVLSGNQSLPFEPLHLQDLSYNTRLSSVHVLLSWVIVQLTLTRGDPGLRSTLNLQATCWSLMVEIWSHLPAVALTLLSVASISLSL